MNLIAPCKLKKNLWFAYLVWLLAWGACAFFEIGKSFRAGDLFARVIGGHPYINDAVQIYNAALLAHRCAGGKIDIYDPVVQDQGIKALTFPIVPETLQFLQYPPQFFALVQPFSALSLPGAYLTWCGLALLLILICLWWLGQECFSGAFARVFLFVACLSSYPCWLSFELGQTSLYQFPATIAFWLLLKRRRFFLAGLLSALLLVKLQYMPPMLIVGFWLGRLRYSLGLLLSATLLAVVTVVSLGLSNILNYPRALQFGETSAKVGGVAANMMQNFRGELVLLFCSDGHLIHRAAVVIFTFGIALICFLWLRLYSRLQATMGQDAFGTVAAFSILLSLICSPHTHIQEFLTASLALVFLYPLLAGEQSPFLRRSLFLLAAGYPLLSWVFFLLLPLFQMVKVQPYLFYALSVLLIAALLVKGRLRPAAQEIV